MKKLSLLLSLSIFLPAFAQDNPIPDSTAPENIKEITAEEFEALQERLKPGEDEIAKKNKAFFKATENAYFENQYKIKLANATKTPPIFGYEKMKLLLEDERDGSYLYSLCMASGEECDKYNKFKQSYKLQTDELDKKCHTDEDKNSCLLFNERVKGLKIIFDETFVTNLASTKPINTIKSETCEWSFDLPRRIISSPGCAQGKKNSACVGYVVCKNTSDVKFVRMSTCSAKNCEEGNAAACTKEAGYTSKNVVDYIDTASKKIKDIIIKSKNQ